MHCLCIQCVQCAIFIEDSAVLFEAAVYGSCYQGTSEAACHSGHYVTMLGYTSSTVHLLTIYCIHWCNFWYLHSSRVESSRDRRSHRSSHHSRSPSRRREPERLRSSSRLPAAHVASRSSSHRQLENRWTRSQERSSGSAVSPAPSDDDGYQPFDRVRVLYLPPVVTSQVLQFLWQSL